jgi:hypothetical protein
MGYSPGRAGGVESLLQGLFSPDLCTFGRWYGFPKAAKISMFLHAFGARISKATRLGE